MKTTNSSYTPPPSIIRREVYDFELAHDMDNLRTIIRQINREGWHIVGFAPYNDVIIVCFRRPAHG